MSSLRWETKPNLRSPVLVAAFRGWNDGGSAATLAAAFLRTRLEATRFAVIDPDDYVDFQVTRPVVSLSDGLTRSIAWPETEFFHAPLPGIDRDLIVCTGVEPNVRWRSFTNEIASLAQDRGTTLVVTLGGLLADTPHSRPVPITGTAHDSELVEEMGLERSRYEGPTGIVGVLHDACARAHLRSASLWAAVPHYVGANPNPSAALALIRAFERLTGVGFEPEELVRASAEFDRQVASIIEGDNEVQAYVRELERRADADAEEEAAEEASRAIPTGDELEAELQRFLRGLREREPGGEGELEGDGDDPPASGSGPNP
jgi:predicted ATP-grasp superfamily ATP-dependent carboligase